MMIIINCLCIGPTCKLLLSSPVSTSLVSCWEKESFFVLNGCVIHLIFMVYLMQHDKSSSCPVSFKNQINDAIINKHIKRINESKVFPKKKSLNKFMIKVMIIGYNECNTLCNNKKNCALPIYFITARKVRCKNRLEMKMQKVTKTLNIDFLLRIQKLIFLL